MTFQSINLGAAPNDGTGDDLRTAGGKINANFDALFNSDRSGDDRKRRVDVTRGQGTARQGAHRNRPGNHGSRRPHVTGRQGKAGHGTDRDRSRHGEAAGLMSPDDKQRLDDALTAIRLATTEAAGLMSPEDKAKLEALTEIALASTEAAAHVDRALTEIALDHLRPKTRPSWTRLDRDQESTPRRPFPWPATSSLSSTVPRARHAKLVPAGAFRHGAPGHAMPRAGKATLLLPRMPVAV
jgi:PHD/YefM family antitoxin component YafN of YafNO toxin-antitoxin module